MGWIYENAYENSVRYVLGEVEENTSALLCFGVNPSTAIPKKLDPTLTKVKTLARGNGYESWIMFNLYPQRATDPNDMHKEMVEEIHEENLKHIKEIFQKHNGTSDILLAYGNLIEKRKYLSFCHEEIMNLAKQCNYQGKILCIKQTKKGHPVHPLYQKNTSVFVPVKDKEEL